MTPESQSRLEAILGYELRGGFAPPIHSIGVRECHRRNGKERAEVILKFQPVGPVIGMTVGIEGSGKARVVRYPRGVRWPAWLDTNRKLEAEIIKAIDEFQAKSASLTVLTTHRTSGPNIP